MVIDAIALSVVDPSTYVALDGQSDSEPSVPSDHEALTTMGLLPAFQEWL